MADRRAPAIGRTPLRGPAEGAIRMPLSKLSAPKIRALWSRLVHDTEAQDALESLLVIGGVVVAIAAALFGFDALIEAFVGHVCPSVDTANPLAAIGSCIG